MKFKTNIKCSGCVAAVTPHLNQVQEIDKWEVDLQHPDRILTIVGQSSLTENMVIRTLEAAGFKVG